MTKYFFFHMIVLITLTPLPNRPDCVYPSPISGADAGMDGTSLNTEMHLLMMLNPEWPSVPAPVLSEDLKLKGATSPCPSWWNKHPDLSFLSSPMGFPIGCTSSVPEDEESVDEVHTKSSGKAE